MSRVDIAARLDSIRERIERAARRSGRKTEEITLVAVSKTRPLEDLLAAWAAGARHFGENRVQEAETKLPALPAGVVKHLIGPIQSNKAIRAAHVASVIHTVDSAGLASRLSRAATAERKRLTVFLEVNLGGEGTKCGVTPGGVAELAEEVRNFPSLDLRGLMAIPPLGESRLHFRTLRSLSEKLSLPELSMGMSDDFEEAIEEGATYLRIGTALFGPRG